MLSGETSPLNPSCVGCRTKMQLASIEPHPDYGNPFETHGFRCEICGKMQSYLLRRRDIPGRVAQTAETPMRFLRRR